MKTTHEHLVNQIQNPGLRGDETLHVIGACFNPMRYHSRYRLFRQWRQRMEATPNVKVYAVELAFGDRHFEVTGSIPQNLQLRAAQEIWHKESLINLAVKYLLPPNWKYLCWSDTDINWVDDSWALEALHQLQHYPLIQPWRDCLDLGFQGTVLQHFQSFCYVYRQGLPIQTHPAQPYKYAHSGFAWACTRKWWEQIVGLMDFPILGSADHHMAFASVGRVDDSIHSAMNDKFYELCWEWERKAIRATQGQLGYVPTRIEHFYHGKKANRKYRERWQILIDHAFDPLADLKYDEQGLPMLIGKPQLLKACRDYFNERKEDGIDEY